MNEIQKELQKLKLENLLLKEKVKDIESRLKHLEGLNNTVTGQIEEIVKKHKETIREKKTRNVGQVTVDKKEVNEAWEMLKNMQRM